MDFGKFRKVSSNQKSTVLEHPDGHKIRVAHEALSPQARKSLESQPMHYAEGGKVDAAVKAMGIDESKEYQTPNLPDYSQEQPAPETPPFLARVGQHIGDSARNTAQGFGDAMHILSAPVVTFGAGLKAGTSGQPYQAPQTDSPAPQQGLPTNVDMGNAGSPGGQSMPQMQPPQMAGMNEQIAGYNGMAAAEQKQGAAQAQAATEHIDQMQRLNAHMEDVYGQLNGERQKLMTDYVAGHIKPEQYMDSKSNTGKISTAIGLILGGISGGIDGTGKNPAMEFLNKQIDRDIDAQKANQESRKNLLAFNQQQFGNARDAYAMTKANLLDLYATQIGKAAAEARGPLAANQAKIAIGQLRAQADQLTNQVAQRTAITQAVGQGTISHEQALPLAVPEKAQEPVRKAIADARESEAVRKWANDNADALGKMTMNGTFSPSQRQSLISPLAAYIEKRSEGRYNHDAALNIAEGYFPNKTDMSEETLNTKAQQRNALFDSELAKNNSVISAYLPPIKSSQSVVRKINKPKK